MEENHQNFRRPLTVTNLSQLNHTSHFEATFTRVTQLPTTNGLGSQETPGKLMDHPELFILLLLGYTTLTCQLGPANHN